MSIQLADRSVKYPRGIVENMLVKVDRFVFPVDFVILDMDEDEKVPLILGRPFLATARALIDVLEGKLTLRVADEMVTFDVNRAMRHTQDQDDTLYFIDTIVSQVSHCFSKFVERDHLDTQILVRENKELHDRHLKGNKTFKCGDQVLLFNSRLRLFPGKLKSRWSGPFTVREVFPYGTIEIEDKGRVWKVNGHRLKHYVSGAPVEEFKEVVYLGLPG